MRKLIAILTILSIIITQSLTLYSAEEEPNPPYSYVLMEGSTGTLLYADNGSAPFKPFHSSKLMTLLLLCEAMDRGELTPESIITVSKHANSQQGSQIWLNAGEKIPLSELITAVTVGNANDACVAIAEAVGGSEEEFVLRMNLKAAELGMQSTVYADSTGMGSGSITTACDIAILAAELSRHDELKNDFTTWMTTVRGGQAELVSQNRLIRTYNGITGMKAYYSKDCGNCLIASAEKNGITMICVILGEKDEFVRFTTAKEKMNIGFSAYSIYLPARKDIFLEPAAVTGGVVSKVETDVGELGRFVIKSGKEGDVEIATEYFPDVTAPIKAGQKVGRVVYSLDDNELYAVDILAKSDVKKMNPFYGLLKLMKSLFLE